MYIPPISKTNVILAGMQNIKNGSDSICITGYIYIYIYVYIYTYVKAYIYIYASNI